MLPHGSGSIDAFLAASLKDRSVLWPSDDAAIERERVLDRVVYHGIAGALVDRQEQMESWPGPVVAGLRERATAQAIWELRHRIVLGDLLEALAQAEIPSLLLKGTALAYDLYDNPAARARGDSDILVPDNAVDQAREVLRSRGFILSAASTDSGPSKLQESWSVGAGDGSRHTIDLHWQTLNSPALRNVLSWQDCLDGAAPLPRLAPTASRPNRAAQLLLACIHPVLHRTAPYFVNGVTHYGGDRLIWAHDLCLISRVLADEEWEAACDLAEQAGIARICQRSLLDAVERVGARVPATVVQRLSSVGSSAAALYLEGGSFKRAVVELRAVEGLQNKFRFALAKLFPPEAFMRAKYPRMAKMPLAILHARRSFGLFRKTSRAADSGVKAR